MFRFCASPPFVQGAAKVGSPPLVLIDTNGPDLPFEATVDAATHRHRSSHSCIAQHFSWVKVGSADEVAVPLYPLTTYTSYCVDVSGGQYVWSDYYPAWPVK